MNQVVIHLNFVKAQATQLGEFHLLWMWTRVSPLILYPLYGWVRLIGKMSQPVHIPYQERAQADTPPLQCGCGRGFRPLSCTLFLVGRGSSARCPNQSTPPIIRQQSSSQGGLHHSYNITMPLQHMPPLKSTLAQMTN